MLAFAKEMAVVVDIANIALQLVAADHEVEVAKARLTEAYNRFKREKGIENVKRESPEWDIMMLITKGEFASLTKAKRKVSTVKRKLRLAVTRASFREAI